MKHFKLVTTFFFAVLFFYSHAAVKAQAEKPLEFEPKSNKNRRQSLLAELELTPEQVREVRRLNRENNPLIRLAQQRLRQANRRLDDAIYADNIDDDALQIYIKDLQNAQVEIIKARSTSELAVRRILTHAQLLKFRELRRRFVEDGENRPNRRGRKLRNFSNQRLNNRQPNTPAPND